MADLQTMTRDDLYRHYGAYYRPNNAVLAIAGDFNTDEMLKRVREVYEAIPAGEVPPKRMRLEPAQAGERRVTVEGPGDTTYLQLAYHIPGAGSPDFLALMALDSLLSGPGNLNLFGEGLSNKTSRLYRALVESELAISVYGGLQATIDPYLHQIVAIVRPERNVEQVIDAIDVEIERLQDNPPEAAELARAVKQARAIFAYGSERITNQAFWLGFSEMFDRYDWYSSYLERLAMVTPEDVQHVAQTYLRRQNRVTGVYLPTGAAVEDSDDLDNETEDGEA
jgi:zinc protease